MWWFHISLILNISLQDEHYIRVLFYWVWWKWLYMWVCVIYMSMIPSINFGLCSGFSERVLFSAPPVNNSTCGSRLIHSSQTPVAYIFAWVLSSTSLTWLDTIDTWIVQSHFYLLKWCSELYSFVYLYFRRVESKIFSIFSNGDSLPV